VKVLGDLDIRGKVVFLRADLDVPLEAGISPTQVDHSQQGMKPSTRLESIRDSAIFLTRLCSELIIAGHMDRPKAHDPALSTKQLVPHLESILNMKVEFLDTLVDTQDTKAKVVLLENLRFFPGEVANDQEFAKKLASISDIYVNEAFGNCHREHASMVALPRLLPHAAGFHLEREILELTKLLGGPARPFVAIVGGAKIETKIPVIENLAKVADFVLVGGYLPVEIKKQNLSFKPNVIVGSTTGDTKDISEESCRAFGEKIYNAETVVWNGPMGMFEEGFRAGTKTVADAITASGAYCVVGGGDTVEFLRNEDLLKKFSFVSDGGGSMLEFLAGKELPGLKALE